MATRNDDVDGNETNVGVENNGGAGGGEERIGDEKAEVGLEKADMGVNGAVCAV